MIIREGTGQVPRIPGIDQTPPVPTLPPGVLDLSMNVPVDSWMANPDTDLLGAHRRKSMLMAVLVLAVVGGLGALGWFALGRGGEEQTKVAAPTITPDAHVRPIEIDAPTGMSKEDITAISRFGYLTIKSSLDESTKPSQRTQIYIDGNLVGTTPMNRLPLAPGPHKIRAVGPKKNQSKMIDTTILGGRDTDEGTIVW
jgi:hypothetical protein